MPTKISQCKELVCAGDWIFGKGWLKLVDELSARLEVQIQKWLDENKDNLTCEMCTRKEKEHTEYYTFLEDGNTVFPIQNIVDYSSYHPNVNPEDIFRCETFQVSYPKAAQVKEKYGGLRFYMRSSTKEMEKEIDFAELVASKTCEDCGELAELCSSGSWVRTLCPGCVTQYNAKGRPYTQCRNLKEIE